MMKKRIEWIDLTKGIAIFMMIAGHIALLPWEPYGKIIFSVHMPLFFILSGYTSKREFSLGYLKKLWNSLLVPYFLCCIWHISTAGFAEQNGRNAKLNGRITFDY
ncbi:MAG: acyltransferase family protein [Ruminococcus sp.]